MKKVEDYVRSIKDFPKEGIIFRDITSVIQDSDGLQLAIDGIDNLIGDIDYDVVVGPESRGFIFGVPIAYKNHKSFVPVRKKGKLPCETISEEYALEYGTAEIEIHKDAIKPGQRVAIVGPTGCGKTTLINLLMRFYDVNSGKISVDGNDICHLTRGSLRTSYGMVLQETWLRAGTIRDNICMGKPDATDEEVIAAAKSAHAHSFIKRLPEGYNTVITEDGGSLSQGQKQLLCIARVMLCLPPMLILDEATSSIDTRTELKIQNAFATMMEGRTSFIVAHRLSTIQEADIILVMKDGNIIEQGSHETLLAKGGFYANLYNSQFAV